MPNAVDLKKAKMYKIGERNLITLFNSFEIAIGNTQSVMGLEKKGYYLPVPVTVLDRSIAKIFLCFIMTLHFVAENLLYWKPGRSGNVDTSGFSYDKIFPTSR